MPKKTSISDKFSPGAMLLLIGGVYILGAYDAHRIGEQEKEIRALQREVHGSRVSGWGTYR
jgi:hypothetical protein